MFKKEILENQRRRKIYKFIDKNPGVYLRELQRILRIPLTSLEHHLNYMVRKKVILKEKDGRYVRYYVKQLDVEDKKILSALRQKRLREIVFIVFSKKKVKYQSLLRNLGIPPSTLSLYLKHLVESNVLKKHRIGRENMYTVQDEDRVAKVLLSYKASFLDKLVDKALYTWMETRFRKSEANESPRT